MRVTVLVGRGCDVVEFLYKPLDLDLTTRTQRGLRSRDQSQGVPSSPDGAFVDAYEGGWQEILPNGGPAGGYAGASLPHHGEASHAFYEVSLVIDSPDTVEILCTARLAILPFRIEKRFRLVSGSAELAISTTVFNETKSALPLMWGHHLAFGAAFVGPGSRITLSSGATFVADREVVGTRGCRTDGQPGVWPDARDTTGARVDLGILPAEGSGSDLHYIESTEGWYRLSTPDGGVELSVSWDVEQFPHLWFWQEFGGANSYPWWDSEYLIGLEPWNSAPGAGLTSGLAQGSVPFLEAGCERSSSVFIDVLERH